MFSNSHLIYKYNPNKTISKKYKMRTIREKTEVTVTENINSNAYHEGENVFESELLSLV